jgi:hypothetical protein
MRFSAFVFGFSIAFDVGALFLVIVLVVYCF